MQRNGAVSTKRKLRTAFDADATVAALQNKTPAQIETWLASNVTTLAQARSVMARLIWFILSRD